MLIQFTNDRDRLTWNNRRREHLDPFLGYLAYLAIGYLHRFNLQLNGYQLAHTLFGSAPSKSPGEFESGCALREIT